MEQQIHTVALTGATGHLGTSLMSVLPGKGYHTRILCRNPSALEIPEHVSCVHGGLDNEPALRELVQGADVMIHSAGIISLQGDPRGDVHRTNVEGTRRLLQLAEEAGVKRFIHISSVHAYHQRPTDPPLSEDSPLAGEDATAYDISKRESQKIVMQYDGPMETVVLNPSSFVGPPDYRPSPQAKAIMDIYHGKVPAIFPGGFDFLDVRDAATAVVNSITMARNRNNYLLSGRWYSMKEMVEIISEVSGKKIKTPVLPVWVAYSGLPVIYMTSFFSGKPPLYTGEAIKALIHGNRQINSEKARQELGFQSRSLKESVHDLLGWLRLHHKIR